VRKQGGGKIATIKNLIYFYHTCRLGMETMLQGLKHYYGSPSLAVEYIVQVIQRTQRYPHTIDFVKINNILYMMKY
jgi:hypothetical protein